MTPEFWALFVIAVLAVAAIVVAFLQPWHRAAVTSPYTIDGKDSALERSR